MVFTLLYVAIPVIALGLIRKYREYTWGKFKSNVPLTGKVYVVTGSNSGVGKETARELARRSACVIMACRDMDKAKMAVEDIRKTTSSGELIPMHLDLASFQSIRDFSDEVLAKFPKIYCLINNAGVYFPITESMKTKNGFEINFGVNYLGHFLLTKLLLDRIKKSAPSRIVVVSSTLHEKGSLDLDDLNLEKKNEMFKSNRVNLAYCASKLANVYHSRELAVRLKDSRVDVYAVCPGFTYTNLFRYNKFRWWQYLMFMPIAFFYLRSSHQGAQTIIRCATDSSLNGNSGNFYKNCQIYESQTKFDSNLQVKLWEKSDYLIFKGLRHKDLDILMPLNLTSLELRKVFKKLRE